MYLRDKVRIATGKIDPDDLRFVILRMPETFFPEELTSHDNNVINAFEDEHKDDSDAENLIPPVIRGFVFDKKNKATF